MILHVFKLIQLDDFDYGVQQFDFKMHYLFYHSWWLDVKHVKKEYVIVYLHWEQFFSFSSFLLMNYILSLQQPMMPFNASMKLYLN